MFTYTIFFIYRFLAFVFDFLPRYRKSLSCFLYLRSSQYHYFPRFSLNKSTIEPICTLSLHFLNITLFFLELINAFLIYLTSQYLLLIFSKHLVSLPLAEQQWFPVNQRHQFHFPLDALVLVWTRFSLGLRPGCSPRTCFIVLPRHAFSMRVLISEISFLCLPGFVPLFWWHTSSNSFPRMGSKNFSS